MAICKKCGKTISDGMKKCPYCNKKLNEHIEAVGKVLLAIGAIALAVVTKGKINSKK